MLTRHACNNFRETVVGLRIMDYTSVRVFSGTWPKTSAVLLMISFNSSRHANAMQLASELRCIARKGNPSFFLIPLKLISVHTGGQYNNNVISVVTNSFANLRPALTHSVPVSQTLFTYNPALYVNPAQ